MTKLTEFHRQCRKVLAEPYHGREPALHKLQEESWALLEQHDADEVRDRALFGGPITDAMLHTALRVAAYDPEADPRRHFNLATLAVQINSWLKPVK